MSKYTEKEKNFLDKAAIACMQGITSGTMWDRLMHDYKNARRDENQSHDEYVAMEAYALAKALLTERKKLFGDE